MTRAFPRRTLLRGIANSAVALPLLTSLNARRSRSQATTFPVRFVAFFTPNGVWSPSWFPTAGATPQQFSLGASHAALAPHIDKLIVTSGIDMAVTSIGYGEPHQRGMGAMLTGHENTTGDMIGGDGTTCGFNVGTSIDQVIAQRLGNATRIGSLELGVRTTVGSATGEIRNRMIYSGPLTPVVPVDAPLQAFERVFADANTDLAVLARRRELRHSILDTTLEQFGDVRAKVGTDEQRRLDEHMSLIRELETRLTSTTSPGAFCSTPATPPELAINDAGTMQAISQFHIDTLVMALACDSTRVASLQYSNAMNHLNMPWVTYTNEALTTVQALNDGHALSHWQNLSVFDTGVEMAARDAWYASQFAYLLSRLRAIPEGDGTMLDNVVVLWVNELSRGNEHAHDNMPFVVAGGAGGRLKCGQYAAYNAVPHNNLLLTLLRAMGHDDAQFGHPDFCTGTLDDLLT